MFWLVASVRKKLMDKRKRKMLVFDFSLFFSCSAATFENMYLHIFRKLGNSIS